MISRFYAVGERGRVRLWGLPGWLVWLVVHLVFLTGFKNRVVALFSWIISFFGRSAYERTITLQQVQARGALHDDQRRREPHEATTASPATAVAPSDTD